ncbi:MAG: hypothetical protein E4G89_01810 [Methanothrix sp.]|nr:MAG: hypothetical protein E4G89_01810 [Methanothrix sp.]
MEDNREETIKGMAANFIRQIQDQYGVTLIPGPVAVEWMAAQIPRLLLFDDATKEGIAMAMGSLLGESIVVTYGGQWEFSKEGGGVRLPNGTVVRPVAIVRTQFTGGTSIASVFSRMAKAPMQPSHLDVHALNASSEASALKGGLKFLAGLCTLFALFTAIIILATSRNMHGPVWIPPLLIGIMVVIAVLAAMAARGFSGEVKRWALSLSLGLGIFSLILFPIGTIVGIFILRRRSGLVSDLRKLAVPSS